MPMQTRQTPDAIRSTASPGRTREAVVATDQPVTVYDPDRRRLIEEILVIDGPSWRDPCPLLLDHSRSIPNMIGSATDFRREPGRLVGSLRFAEGIPHADETHALVDQGHARSVSAGYRLIEFEELAPGQSKTIGGKTYTAGRSALRVVTRWELREVSLVPIPADELAQIRSNHIGDFRPMPATTTATRQDIGNMTFAELAKAELQGRGQTAQNPFEALQLRYSTVEGTADLADRFTGFARDGFRAAVDPWAGIYRVIPADNYLQQQLAAMSIYPTLSPIARGAAASEVAIGVASQTHRVAKFGASFKISEEDAVSLPINAFEIAIGETAAAARRMIADLLALQLLDNVASADGSPTFSVGRGNLLTASLADTALASGVKAVAGQTGTTDDGKPVHINCRPRFLVVPPDLAYTGRKLAREIALGDGNDLEVRVDSRIGATGVADPQGDRIVTGSATNWALFAPASERAGLILAALNGRVEPAVRVTQLDRGEWGWQLDIALSVGATVLSPEGMLWSTGAGA